MHNQCTYVYIHTHVFLFPLWFINMCVYKIIMLHKIYKFIKCVCVYVCTYVSNK